MLRVLLAAVALSFVTAAAHAQGCTLQRLVELDAAGAEGSHSPLIPATLAGRQTRLLIDTAGAWSVISRGLVDELKLSPRTLHGSAYRDMAGAALRKYVRVPGFKLGDINFGDRFEFLVIRDDEPDLNNFGGTVGLNILKAFDVEIDSARKKVAFFLPHKCEAMGPHWADDYASFEFAMKDGTPVAKGIVNGERASIIIDTGSSTTFVDLALARRLFGITPGSPGVVQLGEYTTIGGRKMQMYSATLDTLTISGIAFENVPVHLGDSGDSRQLILGMNQLRHLHLYFAFKEKVIYATAADTRR